MSEHTPGPWIGKKTGSGGQGLIYSEKDGRNVAVIYDERDIPLIESAPKLLAVCKCALADLEGIMPEFEPGGDRKHPAWTTIRELWAAIGQAEGRA